MMPTRTTTMKDEKKKTKTASAKIQTPQILRSRKKISLDIETQKQVRNFHHDKQFCLSFHVLNLMLQCFTACK